jgi:hypothetical protein
MTANGRFFSWILGAVVLAVLMSAGKSPIALADDFGSVSGAVTTARMKNPVAGATIDISADAGTFRIHLKTSESGNFYVVGLEPGWYKAHFSKEGFFSGVDGFEICPGARTSMAIVMNDLQSDGFPDDFGGRKRYSISSTATTVVFDPWPGTRSLRCF